MCDASETSSMNKEAILQDNPELCPDDLEGVLKVEIIRKPDKVYFMLVMPSKKAGHFDIEVKCMASKQAVLAKAH